jgi:sulfur carrier protein ThiS adenylyltransferase
MAFDLNSLKGYSVGIAGCGGLGSNCAVALARVGIGTLIIADFDVIEESNLNRQYYFRDQIGQKKAFALNANINRINPDVKVLSIQKKLESSDIIKLFHDCDVIVEAFDKKEMKQMIIETVLSELPDKPLVVASGLAGWGDNNSLRTRKIDNLYICGDEVTETSEDLPPLGPRVGIVANMQANVVLEIVLGKMNTGGFIDRDG